MQNVSVHYKSVHVSAAAASESLNDSQAAEKTKRRRQQAMSWIFQVWINE